MSGDRLLRLPEVMQRVGLARTTIYRWMSEGRFPRALELSGGAVAWRDSEISSWIASQTTRSEPTKRGRPRKQPTSGASSAV